MPQLAVNRYIVLFKDQGSQQLSETDAQQAAQLAQDILSDFAIHQDSVIHQYKYALKGFAAQLSPEQAALLEKDARIDRVVQDIKYQAIQTSPANRTTANLAALAGQAVLWGVTRVGGPLDGTGKRAWILDTGIDLSHPDLNVDVANSVSFVASERQTTRMDMAPM